MKNSTIIRQSLSEKRYLLFKSFDNYYNPADNSFRVYP